MKSSKHLTAALLAITSVAFMLSSSGVAQAADFEEQQKPSVLAGDIDHRERLDVVHQARTQDSFGFEDRLTQRAVSQETRAAIDIPQCGTAWGTMIAFMAARAPARYALLPLSRIAAATCVAANFVAENIIDWNAACK